MTESPVTSDATLEPDTKAPATYRLVIRAQIIPDTPGHVIEQPSHQRATAWIVAGLAALLIAGWGVLALLRDEPVPQPASQAAAPQPPVRLESRNADARAAQPQGVPDATPPAVAPVSPDAPPAPTREVVPDVPRSALDTIRGTIRVIVRVSIDNQGTVIGATAVERGPSRYFERLSLDAARQWTFTPAAGDTPRSMLVRFHFTRDRATAQSSPP